MALRSGALLRCRRSRAGGRPRSRRAERVGDVAGERGGRAPGDEHYNETGEPPWETLDPEIEWVIDPAAWVGGTYHGHDGARAMLGRLAEAFDYVKFDFDRYLDAGDTVVALGRLRVRGGSSGVSAGQPIGYIFGLRDGLITYARSYLQPKDALEAAGLRK